MDDEVYTFSSADLAVLKAMVVDFKSRKKNSRAKTGPVDVPTAPEVYVARVPSTGISGLGLEVSGTGTGTGTGTATIDKGPLNYADCRIYRLDVSEDEGFSGGNLVIYEDMTRPVYNVGQSKIYGPQFVPIVRHKNGEWIATSNGRDTEMLRVAGAVSGGWYPAYTRDYDVAADSWDDQDFVYVKEPSSGTFAVNDIILDAHLVGTKSGYRRYIAKSSGGSGTSARYGVAQASFTKASGAGTHHSVSVKFCDKDGGNVAAGATTVYLEYRTTSWPNIETGDIVPCVYNDDRAEWQCPLQDDVVGAIKIIDTDVAIPHGWQSLTTSHPSADGRFVMCDATGAANTGGSAPPNYSITVYPGGTTSVTGGACWTYALATDNIAFLGRVTTAGFIIATDINTVKKCVTEKIPEYTITDARPPWIAFRYIIRIDNGI